MRLFEGYEVEGRFRGVFTLFVEGEVPWGSIQFYCSPKKYSQIYFGAGRCSQINWDNVVAATSIFKIVTVEIGSQNRPPHNFDLFIPNLYVVLNLSRLFDKDLELMLSRVNSFETQIKFDTSNLSFLASMSNFISNEQSECNDDIELWRSSE